MALGAEIANLIVALRLDDKGFSGKLNRIAGQLKGMDRGLSQIGKGAGQVGAGLSRMATVGFAAATAGIAGTLKVAGDFEAQLNTINTIALLNESDLKAVGDGIRETFRSTGQPLDDLTAGYYDLLSAGVKVKDAQVELNTAVKLGIGGLGTTAEAVDLLTTAQNSYGLSASEVTQAADIFAKAVADGKVKVSEIAGTFADVAPIAHTAGVSLEEIGAAYGVLTARGNDASSVATQMNRAIVELLKPSGKLVDVQDALGDSFENLIKQKGLVGTLQAVREQAEKMGIPFQDLFGRIEAYKFALATTGPENAAFIEELKRMGKAAGTVDEQFGERQKGLNFSINKLKANLQDAAITIGSELIPVFADLSKQFVDFLNKPGTQQGIKNFAKDLAKGIRDLVTAVKGTDFSSLIDTMKGAASIAKGAFDAFRSLPGPIQQLALAAIVANKVTGGAVGQIAGGLGNIVAGTIKLAFVRGATPANPLFVASVNGGLGGGPGGVPGGGGGGGILGALKTAGVLVLDAVLLEKLAEVFGDKVKDVTVAADYERSQVEKRTAGASLDELKKLREDLQRNLAEHPAGFINDFLKGAFVDPELRKQLDELNAHIAEIEKNSKPLTPAQQAQAARDADRATLTHFPVPPKLDDKALLKVLGRTSEIGFKGVGTAIEQGVKTGLDPFGEIMLGIFERSKDPKKGETFQEATRHLAALEDLTGQYLSKYDTEGAARVQAVKDKLAALIGVTSNHKQITAYMQRDAKAADTALLTNSRYQTDATRSAAAKTEQLKAVTRDRINFLAQRYSDIGLATNAKLSGILAKKSSVTVNATIPVSLAINATQIQNAIYRLRQTVNQGTPYAGFI